MRRSDGIPLFQRSITDAASQKAISADQASRLSAWKRAGADDEMSVPHFREDERIEAGLVEAAVGGAEIEVFAIKPVAQVLDAGDQ